MVKTLLPLSALLALCGCSAVSPVPLSSLLPGGGTGLEVHSETSIRLEQANFGVVKTNLVGRSQGFALLGIITMVPARFTDALNRVYSQAEMQAGRPQTLANVTVERTSAYWILFSIPRVSVRADLVEFVAESAPEPRSPQPADAEPPRQTPPEKGNR
jgi:hypothetical protein